MISVLNSTTHGITIGKVYYSEALKCYSIPTEIINDNVFYKFVDKNLSASTKAQTFSAPLANYILYYVSK